MTPLARGTSWQALHRRYLRELTGLVPRWPDHGREAGIKDALPVGCWGPYGPEVLEAWTTVSNTIGEGDSMRYRCIIGTTDAAERVHSELVPSVNQGLGIQSRVFSTLSNPDPWPQHLGIGGAELRRGQAGIVDYLRVLTSYAHELSDPEIPETLREFAAHSSADAVRLQIRRLVTALERP